MWFGERWITSIFDLFEENSRYFAALLPISSEEDPLAVLDAGGVPQLDELRLHNGTVYRWNRPGLRHQRRRARTCGWRTGCCRPGRPWSTRWPTRRSSPGWSGRWPSEDRPIWTQMSFQAANDNFAAGTRHGIDAEVYWPRVGQGRVTELVVRKLLPLAADGLRAWEVDESEIGRLLGIIEQRCLRDRNGATWQTAEVARREAAGASRSQALHGMLAATWI